jgi:predicted RNA-binding protein with PIN domain
LAVAVEGELASPVVPAPAALVPIMRFSRLPATAYATIARVVDEDEGFRARVAAAAEDDAVVGRVGWLWLHRPDGWEAEADLGAATPGPVATGAPARAVRKPVSEKRRREQADAAARRDVKEQLRAARREVKAATAEVEALRSQLARLEDERNQAVRAAKQLEGDLADARRDRRNARRAAREAEEELAALRSAQGAAPPPVDGPGPAPAADAARAAAAVGQAEAALAALQDHLAEAAGALGVDVARRAPSRPSTAAKRVERAPRTIARTRPAPTLPPGIFEGTKEADRHLVTAGEATVLVDGYNLARAVWSGLEPEEERRRTVAMLEEVAARGRSARRMVVVFDGDSSQVGPSASRAIRVVYSPSGMTADEQLAQLLADLPISTPVVVVSSDRAVAADARARGAVAMSSLAFAAAAGR